MQDVRLALRALRATPIVTVVAILSLALGIGANTAIFTLVDSLILRPLPIADPQRLVILSGRRNGAVRPAFSYATFDQLRRQAQAFDAALAYSNPGNKSPLTIADESVLVDRFFASGDFFSTLGVSPIAGRLFTPADDLPDGGPDGVPVVISFRLWQERFGGAAGAIGTAVTIDRAPARIVGVAPRGFLGLEIGRQFDVVLPIKSEPRVLPSIAFDDDTPWLNIMLRLRPGVSMVSATDALRAVQPQVRAAATPKQRPREFLKEPFELEPAGSGISRRFGMAGMV